MTDHVSIWHWPPWVIRSQVDSAGVKARKGHNKQNAHTKRAACLFSIFVSEQVSVISLDSNCKILRVVEWGETNLYRLAGKLDSFGDCHPASSGQTWGNQSPVTDWSSSGTLMHLMGVFVLWCHKIIKKMNMNNDIVQFWQKACYCGITVTHFLMDCNEPTNKE